MRKVSDGVFDALRRASVENSELRDQIAELRRLVRPEPDPDAVPCDAYKPPLGVCVRCGWSKPFHPGEVLSRERVEATIEGLRAEPEPRPSLLARLRRRFGRRRTSEGPCSRCGSFATERAEYVDGLDGPAFTGTRCRDCFFVLPRRDVDGPGSAS